MRWLTDALVDGVGGFDCAVFAEINAFVATINCATLPLSDDAFVDSVGGCNCVVGVGGCDCAVFATNG